MMYSIGPNIGPNIIIIYYYILCTSCNIILCLFIRYGPMMKMEMDVDLSTVEWSEK